MNTRGEHIAAEFSRNEHNLTDAEQRRLAAMIDAGEPSPDESTLRVIELWGGPLDGKKHELQDPFGMAIEPHSIGIPITQETPLRKAWYTRDEDGQYHFTREEYGA